MMVSNRNLLFQRSIFRCYVSFRECINSLMALMYINRKTSPIWRHLMNQKQKKHLQSRSEKHGTWKYPPPFLRLFKKHLQFGCVVMDGFFGGCNHQYPRQKHRPPPVTRRKIDCKNSAQHCVSPHPMPSQWTLWPLAIARTSKKRLVKLRFGGD